MASSLVSAAPQPVSNLLRGIWTFSVSSVMEVATEIQIHSFAFVFAALRIVGSVPSWLRNRVARRRNVLRSSPPDCLSDPLTGRHQFIKAHGVKYHYVEAGARRHQMVLCLHDFADFWYGWRAQLRGLATNLRVVAPDLKGFGDSEKPFLAGNYKDQVILEELRRLVDSINDNDRKIVLVGHGLGGFLAWKFVEKYPDMVEKFISISTPHPTVWLRHVMRSWRSVYENRFLYMCRLPYLPESNLLENDIEVINNERKKAASMTDLLHFSQLDEEAYKFTFSRASDWRGPVNYYRNLPLSSSSVISAPAPVAMAVETLFIVGNLDPHVSLDLVSQSSEYSSKFSVKIVDGAGHSPHQEKPELVNKFIIKFLKVAEIETTSLKSAGGGKAIENPPDILQLPAARHQLLTSYYSPTASVLETTTSLLSSTYNTVTAPAKHIPLIGKYVKGAKAVANMSQNGLLPHQ